MKNGEIALQFYLRSPNIDSYRSVVCVNFYVRIGATDTKTPFYKIPIVCVCVCSEEHACEAILG